MHIAVAWALTAPRFASADLQPYATHLSKRFAASFAFALRCIPPLLRQWHRSFVFCFASLAFGIACCIACFPLCKVSHYWIELRSGEFVFLVGSCVWHWLGSSWTSRTSDHCTALHCSSPSSSSDLPAVSCILHCAWTSSPSLHCCILHCAWTSSPSFHSRTPGICAWTSSSSVFQLAAPGQGLGLRALLCLHLAVLSIAWTSTST